MTCIVHDKCVKNVFIFVKSAKMCAVSMGLDRMKVARDRKTSGNRRKLNTDVGCFNAHERTCMLHNIQSISSFTEIICLCECPSCIDIVAE